jgi:HD-like signal output (HDOD) protein
LKPAFGLWLGKDVDPAFLGTSGTNYDGSIADIPWSELARAGAVVARLVPWKRVPFLDAWHERGLRVPVCVVLDADSTREDVIAAFRMGVSDVVIAPVDASDAASALRRLSLDVAPPLELREVAVRACMSDLPALVDTARVLPTLWRALSDDSVDLGTVVNIIGQSPRLMAKTIATANHARFASSRPVSSLQEAAVRLGTRNLSLVAHDAALGSVYEIGAYNRLGQEMWRNATAAATGAAAIARLEGHIDPYRVQMFALLHNVGEVAILARVGEASVVGQDDSEFESRLLSIIAELHASVSANVLDEIGAPHAIRTFARFHHLKNLHQFMGADMHYATVTLLAWELAHRAGFTYGRGETLVDVSALCEQLGLSVKQVNHTFAAVVSHA